MIRIPDFRTVDRCLMAFVAVLGVSSTTSAVEVPFDVGVGLPSGPTGALAVRAFDRDNDGDLDLVAAAATGGLEWWKNTAGDASTWTAFGVDPGFSGAATLWTADLDADGDADILGGSATGGGLAWWENGNSWAKTTIQAGANVRTAIAVDMDGDGDLDALSARSAAVEWWENDGAGAFSATATTIVGGLANVTATWPADVDGDGDPDVLMTDATNGVAWLVNTAGDGSAWILGSMIDSTLTGARAVIAADADGDGDLDAFVASETLDQVGWWENLDGTGAFSTGSSLGAVDGAWSLAAADVDLDGDLDILAAGTDGDMVTWFENTLNEGAPWAAHTVSTAVDGARSALAADLDGDGDPDLVAAAFDGNEVVWWQNLTIHGSGSFPLEDGIASFVGNPEVHSADVDGDGDLDVLGVSVSFEPATWWENLAGDGSQWAPHSISTAGHYVAAPADVDGDGDVDLVVGETACGPSAVVWWENDLGDGSSWTLNPIDDGLCWVDRVETVDLDGDGDLDVLAAVRFDNLITWWENPSWTEHVIDNAVNGASWVTSGDVNGDGDPDVLGISLFADLVLWWENPGWAATTISGTLDGVTSLDPVDLDRDGDLDLLIANGFNDASFGTDKMAWLENTAGDGSAWNEHLIDANVEDPWSARAADLDRDGDLDAVAVDSARDEVTWWENKLGESGGWIRHPVDTTSVFPWRVEPADLDRDGRLDLLLSLPFNAEQISWRKNRSGQFALPTADSAPPIMIQGTTDDLLLVDAFHRGRSGDSDVELVTLELLLEESPGDPLTTEEMDALLTNGLQVYLDDGSGVFDPADTLVTTTSSGVLTNGVLTLSFTDGDANVQVTDTSSRTYFVVAELTLDAASQTPNTFRVTHLTESSSGGEDASRDLPIVLEWAANVSSTTVTATADCNLLSVGHTGQGLDPATAPPASPGCPNSEYMPGQVTTLTAAPDAGWTVASWNGTDDDNSTSETNTATMPAGSHTVTVVYVSFIFSDGFETGDTSQWSSEVP